MTGRAWMLAAAAALATGNAHAGKPVSAVLPTTAEGVSPATLEVVDSILMQKIPDLGYEPVSAREKAAGCEAPGCPGKAAAIAKSLGAAKVVGVHLARDGDEVVVQMLVHDAATGRVDEGSARTTAQGVLAQVVKLLRSVLGKPPPPVVPEPAPAAAAPAVEPAAAGAAPVDAYAAASKVCEASGVDARLRLYSCMWARTYMGGRILIGTGAAFSLAGVALTIASGVLWKKFDDWIDGVDRTCEDCIRKSLRKVKVNSVVTGLAAATFLPGVAALVTGLVLRGRLLALHEEQASLVPELSLSAEDSFASAGITLTWTY
jgi:hypothetical protein